MKKPLIIVPIKSTPIAKAISDAKLAHARGAGILEMRLDFIAPKNQSELRALFFSTNIPCIATNRPTREGGNFKGTEAKRVQLLKGAVLAGAKYVDIELSTSPRLRGSLIKFARSKKAKAIVSFHDFSGTPPLGALSRILEKEMDAGADVAKIVTFAKAPQDNAVVLELLADARREKISAIIFAMGKTGRQSRIDSFRQGAWAGFATLGTGKGTAAGQLSIPEMRGVLPQPQDWKPYGTENAKVCCLLGFPIGHSVSPLMQNAAFKKLGLDCKYLALPVAPENLSGVFDEMRAWQNFLGANVTIPHKEAAAGLVGGLDSAAKKIGAINTVVTRGGRLCGSNTDAPGFLEALKSAGFSPRGKKAVVLGAGGVGRAIAFALAGSGASEVCVLNRTLEKAEALAEEVSKKTASAASAAELNAGNLEEELANADLLVNATSIGMSPRENQAPVAKKSLHGGLCVFDSVYNPRNTRFLRDAKSLGCKTITGDLMLLHQGALAFELWAGKRAPIAEMKRALAAGLAKNKGTRGNSIVLVGFMGTGKSSVGKALAKRLGKRFVDTDALAEKSAGKKITEIFSQKGEAFFRSLEKKAVQAACKSKNAVISTGGGCVLDPENVAELRNAGILVRLDSTAKEIAANLTRHSDRPLLAGGERLEKIEKMLAWRRPYYLQADLGVQTKGRLPEEIAKEIARRLKGGNSSY
ncbi:MAG: shikimate dehydrogenase [Candidatus Micrarchaeia archaeon]|jgi:3-dehydroquinate dehydratase/shikimate dehydrogenase